MSRSSGWMQAVLVAAVLAGGPARAEQLSLAQAIERALQAHPEVKSARADVDAATAGVEAASVLLRDNPEVNGVAGPRYVKDARTLKLAVELQQPVEIAGQRPARIRAAKAELERAKNRLASIQLEVSSQTVEAWLAVLAAEAQLRGAEAAVEFARRASDAARERFAAGDATRLDVNTALVELGHSQREVLAAKRDEQKARADLAEILAEKSVADLRPSVPLERLVEALSGAMERELPSLAAAVEQGLAQRPDLAAARADAAAAAANHDVERRSAVPNPGFGVGYERDGEEQIVYGMLTVGLPLFDRNLAPRADARAREAQASVALQVLERQVRREIEIALARLVSARKVVASFEAEINAAAAENLELAEEAYRSGKLDLVEILAIQRNSLESRRAYIEALQELAAAYTELSRAMGQTPVISAD